MLQSKRRVVFAMSVVGAALAVVLGLAAWAAGECWETCLFDCQAEWAACIAGCDILDPGYPACISGCNADAIACAEACASLPLCPSGGNPNPPDGPPGPPYCCGPVIPQEEN
jgi:hypothetical protein